MSKQTLLKKNTLVAAVGIAVMGGLSGCSSDSGGGAAAAAFAILLGGGAGGNGDYTEGGNGGDLNVYNSGATGGVEVRNSGAANTNFTTPVQPGDPDLGDNPLEITSNTTLSEFDDQFEYDTGEGFFSEGDIYLGVDGVFYTKVAPDGAADLTADTAVASGTNYVRSSDERIATIDAADAKSHTVYTGLSVAEGTILTLSGVNGSEFARLRVTNDIDNQGTITNVDQDGPSGGGIDLTANKYYGGDIFTGGINDDANGGSVTIETAEGIVNDGTIDTSGFDEDDASGGLAGGINMRAGGYILNNGALIATGGDTGQDFFSGGGGGNVRMFAAYTENNGAIDTSGGSGVREGDDNDGYGGSGGLVQIAASFVANNTGAITTVGGNGAEGGAGAPVIINNEEVGEAKNAGDVDMSGGAATEYNDNSITVDYEYCNAAGYGGMININRKDAAKLLSKESFSCSDASNTGFISIGTSDGGDFALTARGGSAINSGNIIASGGDSQSDNFSYAGNGGDMMFYTTHGVNDEPPGDVSVSGNLTSIGGNDTGTEGLGFGGDAGDIDVGVQLVNECCEIGSTNFSNQKAVLYGYESISLNGGDAGGEAGDGGDYDLTASFTKDKETGLYKAGSVLNQVPVNASGGNSTANTQDPVITGTGGDGGDVDISTAMNDSVNNLNLSATNTADFNLNGGSAPGIADPDGLVAARGTGGDGGRFELSGYASANNQGAVEANGGPGGEDGGHGGDVWIDAVSGAASNTGGIGVSGADGGNEAGHAGDVDIYGKTASNNTDITANGGNATGPLTTGLDSAPDEIGGDGGYIGITAQGLTGATNSGALSVAAGTGSTENGEEGCTQVNIEFDGNCTFDD